MLEHLASTSTYSMVYALSRRPPVGLVLSETIKFSSIDFLAPVNDIAARLAQDNVTDVDDIFFFAYKASADEQVACDENGKMLDGLLKAVEKINGKEIGRIVLQTGGKHYGVHLGTAKMPAEEDDPRILGPPPNFYYVQEDILFNFCKGKGTKWNVTRAADIVGVAKGNAMNIAVTVFLYASIVKELGEDFIWPGNDTIYKQVQTYSTSSNNAEFMEWLVQHEETANQAYNMCDNETPTWSQLWPAIASWFGLTVPKDHLTRPAPLPTEYPSVAPSPISVLASKPQTDVFRMRLDLTKWSERPEVRKAAESLVEKYGLDPAAFGYSTWDFANFTMGRTWPQQLSMKKAARDGWHKKFDTTGSFKKTLEKAQALKLVPKFEEN